MGGPVRAPARVSVAGGRLARAAALIAAITILARLAGFARTVVFGRSVGSGCVGAVYQTANTIPNIVFDIVAGGVLSALVVPILAPYFAAGDRAAVSRTVSALLTWALVVLVPAAGLIALLSGPLVRVLLGPDACPGAGALGTRMLVVFAPQVVVYGLAVIVSGVLQAGERFAWPALAPLLSSLVVIAAYLWYGALAGSARDAVGLPRSDELILSVGTTAGVLMLAACQLPALRRSGVRLRPTFRFPDGLAPAAQQAAVAGVLTLATQQLSSAVMIRLANEQAPPGTVVIATLAQTVFLLPWAVLSVPVATSAFPRLSTAWDAGQFDAVRRLAATSVRVVIALSALGTAVLVACAEPVANVLLRRGSPAHAALAPTIAAFALGLVGWSLVALLARCLYAARRTMLAAAAQVSGQLVVIGADIVLAVVVSARWRAVVLAVGNAVGVWVAVALLFLVARRTGVVASLRPVAGHLLGAALAAGLGALAGWSVGRLARGEAAVPSLLLAVAAAALATAVAGVFVAVTDRGLLAQLRTRVGR